MKIILLLMLTLLGCGKEQPGLKISLKFPLGLTKDQKTFQKFTEKYSSLSITVSTKEGFEKEYKLITSQSKNTKIEGIQFPKNDKDILLLKAQFKEYDNPNSKIIASGKAKLSAHDYNEQKMNEVTIPVSLHIPVEQL